MTITAAVQSCLSCRNIVGFSQPGFLLFSSVSSLILISDDQNSALIHPDSAAQNYSNSSSVWRAAHPDRKGADPKTWRTGSGYPSARSPPSAVPTGAHPA